MRLDLEAVEQALPEQDERLYVASARVLDVGSTCTMFHRMQTERPASGNLGVLSHLVASCSTPLLSSLRSESYCTNLC